MKFNTEGLIIREQVIGEKDKLITALTDSNGVISAFVRGAKNMKSPKCAATQLLCYSQLGIYKGRDKYIVDEASVKEMFVRLRTDVLRMSYAQYFCELALRLCPREQPAKEFLRLMLNGIYLLSAQKKEPLLVKACVEMRVLCLSGYMPDLMMCSNCGKYEAENMYFLPDRGILLCSECFEKSPSRNALLLSSGTVRALRHTAYSDFEKLFSFGLPESGLKALNSATEQYLVHRTEYDFKTLEFLKQIE